MNQFHHKMFVLLKTFPITWMNVKRKRKKKCGKNKEKFCLNRKSPCFIYLMEIELSCGLIFVSSFGTLKWNSWNFLFLKKSLYLICCVWQLVQYWGRGGLDLSWLNLSCFDLSNYTKNKHINSFWIQGPELWL